MATSNYSAWQKEAEEEAKRYSDQLKSDNQQILDTLTNAKNNALQQLQEQQNNAIYNINTNKSTINANAENNAKQLYVNKLLALKSNDSAMKRAGLGSQGIVGSQVNSINNNYGTNLASVLNQKSSDLQNLEKEKNNILLNYNTNRVDLTNQDDTNYSNALASINDKALAEYKTIYNNYLAMKQQQYENEQAELARQEQIRQFNEQMALERAAMYYNKNSGGGYTFDDTVETPVNNTNPTNQNSSTGTTPKGNVLIPSKSYSTVLQKAKNMKPTKDNRQSNANYQKQLDKWKDKVASYLSQELKAGRIKDFEVKSILSELGLR